MSGASRINTSVRGVLRMQEKDRKTIMNEGPYFARVFYQREGVQRLIRWECPHNHKDRRTAAQCMARQVRSLLGPTVKGYEHGLTDVEGRVLPSAERGYHGARPAGWQE